MLESCYVCFSVQRVGLLVDLVAELYGCFATLPFGESNTGYIQFSCKYYKETPPSGFATYSLLRKNW